MKKIDEQLEYRFIEKLLFPINILGWVKYQMDVCKKVCKSHSDLAEKFEKELIDKLQEDFFKQLNILDKISIIKKILDSKCLSEKNQILVNSLLRIAESEISKDSFSNINCISREEIITSEKYMKDIKSIYNFRDKMFMIVNEEHGVSWFSIMMFDNQIPSISDIFVYNGITNNKYKNSTLMRINKIKSQMMINTASLINAYKNEFWTELNRLVEDVEQLSKITVYLNDDLKDIRFLLDNKKWFIASTFLSQMIERLLRELFFRLEYGVAGFTRDANFSLSKLVGKDEDKNSLVLTKLFNAYELNALSYFLNDRDNGENIRNVLAHYTVNKCDIDQKEALFLLDIVLFILLKVYYNGVAFEEKNN